MITNCNFSFLIFRLIVSVLLSDAYNYNDVSYSTKWSDGPRYPGDCCALEWIDIKLGQPLPPSAIIAGNVGGEKLRIPLLAHSGASN